MMFRKRTAILLIIAIGLFIYFIVLRNNFILGDDEDQIINHIQVHSLVNIPRFFFESTYYRQETNQSYGLFYRPLMISAYTLLYSVFGPNPRMFHLVQLLLHITNAIIVFYLLISFFPELLSFIIALIFLVHPINSETVVHSANLQDILFFLFGSLALLTILKRKINIYQPKAIFLFSLCLLLSVFSKETGIAFALLSLVYVFLFDKRRIRIVAIAVAIVLLLYSIFRFLLAHVGFGESAISRISHADLFIRMLNIPSIIIKYISTFMFPLRLETAQLWIIEKADMSGFYFPLLIIAILIVLWIFVGIKIRRSNKKILPIYVLFSVWFLTGISLHLQIIPLDVTVAERWFYFPIVGLLGMIASTYYALFYRQTALRKACIIMCLLIIILFSVRTFLRVRDWSDSLTLFTRELQTSPHNYLIENNLGTLYLQDKQYEKARPYIADSVKQYPYLENLNNMAILFAHDKNYREANEYFTLALQHGSSYLVYKNYANFLLYIAKDYPGAYRVADRGIGFYPTGSELYLIRAQVNYHNGNSTKALKDAQYAYRLFSSKWAYEIMIAIKEKRKLHIEKYYKLD